MKKMVVALMCLISVAGLCNADEMRSLVGEETPPAVPNMRSFQERYQDATVNDILQSNDVTGSSSVEYHKKKLKNFEYCAVHKPSESRVAQALVEAGRGTATKEDLHIIATNNFCDDHDNDWERRNYWPLFYHVRELGKAMGWSTEKIIQEKAAALSHLLAVQEARYASQKQKCVAEKEDPKKEEPSNA